MKRFLSLLSVLLVTVIYAQKGNINISVYDAFNQKPISASVSVQNQTYKGVGEIQIDSLQAGNYNFEISAKGYEKEYLNDINIIPNQTISFSVELNKSVEEFNESAKTKNIKGVVIQKRKYKTTAESPVSLRNITSEEVQKNAGSNRDISKAILSFPGVGSTASFRNDLLIRGGNSAENKFFIDGIEVPVINHFQTQGASGGPRGIITVDFIKDVDFYSGAFPAKRDGMLSSLFEFHFKKPRKNKLGYKIVLGLDDMQLMADGRLSKDESWNGLFSVRKSNLQLLFKGIGLPFLPSYYDASFKVAKKFKNGNQLYFLGLGAIDNFKFNENAKQTPYNKTLIERLPQSPQWSYTMGAGYKHSAENGHWLFTLSRSQLDNKAIKYYQNKETPDNLLYDYQSQEIENKLRIDRKFSWLGFKFGAGTNLKLSRYENNSVTKNVTQYQINNDEINSKIDFLQYGFYINTQKKLFDNRLKLALGVRADASNYSSQTNNPFEQFSPRLSLRYRLSNRWSINFNTGKYFQLPAYTSLGFMKNNTLVNKDRLKYIQNTHVVSGVEFNGKHNLRITLEGYYKKYRHYPFSLRNQVSLANLGTGFGFIGNEPLDSRGKGETYGLEVLVQKRTVNDYYGILAYTFGYSQFSNGNEKLLASSWDNRHILSATLGKNFRKNWNIGAKFRLQSGAPETPYDLERSALVNVWNITNAPIQDYTRINSLRGNLTHQLDVRVEKKWVFKKWQFTTYFDIVNIYGAKNPSRLPIVVLDRDDNGNGIIANPSAPENDQKYVLTKEEADNTTPLPYFGFIFEF
ncbi:MAG: ferric aerobactin receptor [Flavobacteriales bacterium]|nr:MAG: ferric aerobactin receptor [Flavobacteriales bacterium]